MKTIASPQNGRHLMQVAHNFRDSELRSRKNLIFYLEEHAYEDLNLQIIIFFLFLSCTKSISTISIYRRSKLFILKEINAKSKLSFFLLLQRQRRYISSFEERIDSILQLGERVEIRIIKLVAHRSQSGIKLARSYFLQGIQAPYISQ